MSSATVQTRSWVDVVRGSTEDKEGVLDPIEESCEDSGSRRNPNPSLKAGTNQWRQHIGASEQNLAFKRWARGRCYRCLSHNHQVRYCKAPFRCIRCGGPGHRERQCRFRSSASSSFGLPSSAPSHLNMQHMDVGSKAPSQRHQAQVPLSSSANGRIASFVSTSSDPKGEALTLPESLKSELMHLFEVQLETLLRPIREEMSAIKVWLARAAANVEGQKQDTEHMPTLNIGELFGPYSPVRFSSTSALLETLAAERTAVDPLGSEDACMDMADSSPDQTPVQQPMQKEERSVEAVGQPEGAVLVKKVADDNSIPNVCMVVEDPVVFEAKVSSETLQELPSQQTIEVLEDPQKQQMLIQDGSGVEDAAPVEDALNDEITSHTCMTRVDSCNDSLEGPYTIDGQKDSSSLGSSTTKRDEKHTSPSCGRSSFGKLLLRRSKHLARSSILKDLGFVKKNEKLDKGKLEAFGDLLEDLLPPDLLLSLRSLKGRALWKVLALIFDPVC